MCNIHRKTPLLESLFNKYAGLKDYNFIKIRLQHGCFSVNIAKFLKNSFFIEHLWWLLMTLKIVTRSKNGLSIKIERRWSNSENFTKMFLNDSYRQSVVFASLLIESFSIYLLRITNFSNMLENELLLWINPWISSLYLPNSRDGIFFLLMQNNQGLF